MNDLDYKFEIDLRWGGFDGGDLNQIMDDNVVTERPITCSFTFSPTCGGPESWRILLLIASPFAVVGTVFLQQLGKDLYNWLKTRVNEVFTRKSNGDGFALIRFQDLEIEIPYHPSDEIFADVWLELYRPLQEIDPTICNRFTVKYEEDTKTIRLIPTMRT